MINHVRTLLINRKVADLPRYGSVDEFVPTDYKPAPETAVIRALRNNIFGSDPDLDFVNYRAHMCMRLLHGSPWAAYITHRDSRITYDIKNQQFFNVFNTTVTTTSDLTVGVTGKFWADEITGRVSRRWTIAFNGTDVTVVDTFTNTTQTQGRTDVIKLVNSNLYFALPSTASEGFYAEVIARAKPVRSITDIIDQISPNIAQAAASEIFSHVADSEIRQLFALWNYEPLLLCKYAALLLGLARHTELLNEQNA